MFSFGGQTLVGRGSPPKVLATLQAGASGYVLKKSVAKEVVDAIRMVHKGGRYLSKQLAEGDACFEFQVQLRTKPAEMPSDPVDV